MWKVSESTVRPVELDTVSSKSTVYVRRNIEKIPTVPGEGSEGRPEMWRYEENEIPKNDWETYQNIAEHSATLHDVEDALVELAEMIAEV